MTNTDTATVHAMILAAATKVRALPDPVPAGSSFADLGIDSLDRLALVDVVEQRTGLAIPDSVLADADGVDDLVTYLTTTAAVSNRSGCAPDTPAMLGTVEDGATVGPGSRLWHQSHVACQARIGQDCTLGKGAYIGTGSQLGDRVKIGNYACVFGASIADDAMISPHAALLEDPAPRATTPDGRRKQSTDFVRRPVTIHTRATVGAGALIAPGITIGHDALVALGAVVVHDVPAHALVAGNPARQCGWVCTCGHTLTEQLHCPHCPRTYTHHGHALAPIDAAATRVPDGGDND